MNKKHLVAFDFDPASRAALAAALQVDGAGEIVLFHAAKRRARTRQAALGALEDEAAIIRELGFEVRVRIQEGAAIKALHAVLEDEQPDLIFVGRSAGTKTRPGGHVARSIFQTSGFPVLAIPASHAPLDLRGSNVIVGVDFFLPSLRAADEAALLARRIHGRMTLIHVRSDEDRHPPLDRSDAARRLEVLATAIRARGVAVTTRIRAGDPATQIVGETLGDPATVIAIGTREHGLIERFVANGIADQVLSSAPGSVLIVAGPPAAAESMVVADAARVPA